MRILLTEKSRNNLFEFLKKRHGAKTLKELSEKIDVPFKTLQKWRLGTGYLPSKIIPEDLTSLNVIDKQEDNWGQVKGGKNGLDKKIANLKKIWHNPKYHKLRTKIGRLAKKNLINEFNKELVQKAIKTKIKKREDKSRELELENNSFFINKKIQFNNSIVKFSNYDKIKKIELPQEMSAELSEELGVHLGDGCLSYNKKYFSVKTNKKEKNYVLNFLFPLFKQLYNLDLKLMRLKSVVGFEICSQALFEFKNKVLGIPYGEKKERIEIPKSILETKNKEIYRACIRGLFDTDGCVNIVKSKKNYPIISFTIKSKKLIEQTKDMLLKLGFIPTVHKWTISVNGTTMLEKWIKEIGSNNPKNKERLNLANNLKSNKLNE
jgi:hypothetical protein